MRAGTPVTRSRSPPDRSQLDSRPGRRDRIDRDLVLLLACKGLAWGALMGSFRGGPVFPAIFVGTVGGLLASHLPGFPEGAAVATVMAAGCRSRR
jgi:hypothetical protein